MWYTLIVALKQYLASQSSLSGAIIRLGDSAQTFDEKTIVLLRGESKPDERLRNIRGIQTLHIECWVKGEVSDTEQALLDGYQQLAQLESDLADAIQVFGREPNTVDGYHIRVKLNPFQPDQDQFRPLVASRLTIEITHNKINP